MTMLYRRRPCRRTPSAEPEAKPGKARKTAGGQACSSYHLIEN